MTNFCYLDNSTTTKPSGGAVTAMMPFLSDRWGTPAVPHDVGQRLIPHIDKAYSAIKAFLGDEDTYNISFVSSGAEAVTTAIISAVEASDRKHIIVSDDAEAPHVKAAERLGTMTQAPLGAIALAITENTALVSLSYANGMTGVINNIAEIAEKCREKGALLHVDVSHVAGKSFFDIDDIDIITFAGDLIHSTKSSGIIAIKKEIALVPAIAGATTDVANLVALGYAAKEALENRDGMSIEIARFRDMFEDKATKAIKDSKVLFHEDERVPHCSCITFSGVHNEALLYKLNKKNVYATIGGGKFQQLHSVLTKKEVDKTTARSAISFSMSRYTTEEDIDYAIETLADAVDKLRKMSEGVL
ncbi:MAG: aminotransferase class V-fold PLP-dependent enzyme [Waddliaceae bacterium]|nr:aminotransferase class V-fold PLP-dependent enzyme [Waddliaceae bacterium]